ncbi:hypothetical protein AGMMS4952_24500 [Spirochaetia bacterium]|nr:hypothetical protein AGMMS4952_24500 [Spirochaetia bacterium]
MELSAGYSGGGIVEGTNAEPGKALAEALAHPVTYPGVPTAMELPAAPGDRGSWFWPCPGLLLKKRPLGAPIGLAFLYGDGAQEAGLEEAAESCVRLYKQQSGVYARGIRVGI